MRKKAPHSPTYDIHGTSLGMRGPKVTEVMLRDAEPYVIPSEELKRRLGRAFRIRNFLETKLLGNAFMNMDLPHTYDPKTGCFSPVDVVCETKSITQGVVQPEESEY